MSYRRKPTYVCPSRDRSPLRSHRDVVPCELLSRQNSIHDNTIYEFAYMKPRIECLYLVFSDPFDYSDGIANFIDRQFSGFKVVLVALGKNCEFLGGRELSRPRTLEENSRLILKHKWGEEPRVEALIEFMLNIPPISEVLIFSRISNTVGIPAEYILKLYNVTHNVYCVGESYSLPYANYVIYIITSGIILTYAPNNKINYAEITDKIIRSIKTYSPNFVEFADEDGEIIKVHVPNIGKNKGLVVMPKNYELVTKTGDLRRYIGKRTRRIDNLISGVNKYIKITDWLGQLFNWNLRQWDDYIDRNKLKMWQAAHLDRLQSVANSFNVGRLINQLNTANEILMKLIPPPNFIQNNQQNNKQNNLQIDETYD